MRLEDVQAIRLRRAQTNHETYRGLFDACCSRIRRRAHLPDAPRGMLYPVPPFVWGRPPFKHAHAVRYVSEKLRRNGFAVTEASPGVLHVDWTRAHASTRKPKASKRRRAEKAAKPKPAKPSKLSARLEALRRQLG